jgi:PKD domain
MPAFVDTRQIRSTFSGFIKWATKLLLTAIAIVLLAAAPAGAAIVPPTVLDGPSSSVVDVDGAALAPDGSGGIVYRKLEGGAIHVFVARFLDGTWSAPIRVDYGQLGPATQPTIAAADGGQLLVTWVQPWTWISATAGAAPTLHYELMSALLQRGASSFGQIERVDDLGDGTAAYPSLAMAPNGNAYVAYRVVTNAVPVQPLRPGDENVEDRVARFNGLAWSSLGTIDRLPGQVTARRPSATDGPVVGVNSGGQALVVWQESDPGGVARIWARRLFGTVKGPAMEVSPTTIEGKPVSADADAPALALNEFGGAEVAFRLAGGPGSPLGSSALLLDRLSTPAAGKVSAFAGAAAVGTGSTVGTPDVVASGNAGFVVACPVGGNVDLVNVGEGTETPQTPLGPGAGPVFVSASPTAGAEAAWAATGPEGLPAVQVEERYPTGGWQNGFLSAPISGPIGGLVAAASGEGDELLGFEQGSGESSQVVGTFAQAPPESFYASAPTGWVGPSKAWLTWKAAGQGVGSVTYSVLVDGRLVDGGLRRLSTQLPRAALGSGLRQVRVLATDQLGQRTMSPVVKLRVQGEPPLVEVKALPRRRVRVRIYGDRAGLKKAATLVSFGDGETTRRRPTVVHTYPRPGRYTVTVRALDRVGNHRLARVEVTVR